MSPIMILLMICVLVAGVLPSGQIAVLPDPAVDKREAAPPMGSEPSPDTPLWTTWGARQYALADDGAFIWIGATGGLLRWDKAQGSYRRITPVDGLPHTVVLAVAVDGAGNRWFGGDGGLSRLDPGENWTHFRAANSGLYSDLVDGIAVVAGDTLYLSHGLPGGSVSRRASDGAWRWFPNRETAIQADYVAILQTRVANRLWTVAGNEIWAGSRVFDGGSWHERKLPTPSGEPVATAADSQNHVWALSGSSTVYEWDGASWLAHAVQLNFSGKLTALAVDQEDRVWIGLQEQHGSTPYGPELAGVMELSGAQKSNFNIAGPVVALLPTQEGLWGVGPSWLMQPGFTVRLLGDEPRFEDLRDAMASGDGSIWLYSAYPPLTIGAVQTLDDRGTLALQDDTWQAQSEGCELVTAFERAGADTWYASYCEAHVAISSTAVRYRGGQRIEYSLWWADQVSDIFAQDQDHIWFAVWGSEGGKVRSLDDGGTPADTGDDVWRTFPIGTLEGKPVVAVDALGRLWLGQTTGLYRYDGSSWRLIYGKHPVCDLAPAADGTLYAQVAVDQAAGCEEHSDRVLVVRADGTIEDTLYYSKWLIQDEAATVRTARRRNSLWAVASDGAIWYISHLDPGQELQRRSGSGLSTYALPVAPEAVRRLEVDPRGHVWLVADSQLWRMEGPRPIYLHLPMVSR